MDSNHLESTIEMLVDRNGLPAVLEALAKVCAEKAEHLRSAWNDLKAAQNWDRLAHKVEKIEKWAY